jgi:threonyl-tRNA synthetase
MHKLKELLRTEYDRLGYQEIATPLLYHPSLWETSGHWQNYREDMFLVGGGHGHQGSTSPSPTDSNLTGHELFGLKPMNCPAHCLIFKSESRSYRDLPIRLADFTPLHRNELSGTLTGLTRLRQFHQDDAHIFCTTDQVSNEIASILDMFHRLYIKTFKFPSYSLVLSTRPESFIGSEVDWNRAETTLKSALDQHAQLFPELPSVRVEKGAGAFYGPKIDLLLNDSQHRTHQLATVQLDFQLPHRFQLEYVSAENNRQRPVVIHRAVLGSLERFWAIWMEETKGRWDLWCNPRQILVLPVHAGCLEYAQTLMEALKNEKYHVDVDARDLSLSKRVREGQTMQYNYSVIIGDQEVSERQVAIRRRGQSATDHMSLSSFLQQLTTERDQFK